MLTGFERRSAAVLTLGLLSQRLGHRWLGRGWEGDSRPSHESYSRIKGSRWSSDKPKETSISGTINGLPYVRTWVPQHMQRKFVSRATSASDVAGVLGAPGCEISLVPEGSEIIT